MLWAISQWHPFYCYYIRLIDRYFTISTTNNNVTLWDTKLCWIWLDSLFFSAHAWVVLLLAIIQFIELMNPFLVSRWRERVRVCLHMSLVSGAISQVSYQRKTQTMYVISCCACHVIVMWLSCVGRLPKDIHNASKRTLDYS